MDLRNYFDQLTPEKRVMQFGRKTDEPLRLAFDSKRVVHAAMGGSMVPPSHGAEGLAGYHGKARGRASDADGLYPYSLLQDEMPLLPPSSRTGRTRTKKTATSTIW